MEKNVIVAVFNVESEGFQAFTELSQNAAGETYVVPSAALVKKKGDSYEYLDGFDAAAETRSDTMIGGLIGMTIGLLGGPLGVLIGGSSGALIGSASDAEKTLFSASMLDQIADKLDDGMVALVALAEEESNDALDAKLSAYDTIIARFDAAAVADEVGEAYEKQAEMARLARMELRKEEREEINKHLEENQELLMKGFTK